MLKKGDCHEFEVIIDYVVSLEHSELHNETLPQQNENQTNNNNNKHLTVCKYALHDISVVDQLRYLLS